MFGFLPNKINGSAFEPLEGMLNFYAKKARRGEFTCFHLICQPIFTETEAGLMTEGLAFSMSLQTKMRLKQIIVHDTFWPTREQATAITGRHRNLFIFLSFDPP